MPAGSDPSPLRPGAGDVPQEQPLEVEAPRRAASARLEVDSAVGTEAALREAMDPANQSLAEALRLSYHLLKVVILVLVALFFVSGFQRVDQGQSGVMLRFGRIVGEALEPGLRRNLLPSPAGEFIIFGVRNLSVDLDRAYWPDIPANVTFEQAVERADVRSVLQPGQVGYVMTSEGDIAHVQVVVDYEIEDPVQFVEQVALRNEKRFLEAAVRRAVVHVAAGLDLQQLVEEPEEAAGLVLHGAQDVLDALHCGIRLVEVKLRESRPPLAIVKAYGQVQESREEANQAIEESRQNAEETLIGAGGAHYPALVELVTRYRDAIDRGDTTGADELLAAINGFLEGDRAGGELSGIIRRAQAYESDIELNLGNEARRFASLLPRYREQPELEVKRRWYEAVRRVMGREDAEIFRVPASMEAINVRVTGLQAVQDIRKQQMLKRREEKAALEAVGLYKLHMPRAGEWEIGKSNPLLDVKGGRVRPKGADR